VFLTSRDLAVCNTRPLCDAGRVYSDTVNHSHGNLAVCMVRSSHMFLSGRRRSRASMSSAQPGWPRRSQSTSLTARLYVVCPPPPADAMTDVTQVVLLSVRRELRSEYAEHFLDIFCGLSHSVPVKVGSWSIPGGKTAGQQ